VIEDSCEQRYRCRRVQPDRATVDPVHQLRGVRAWQSRTRAWELLLCQLRRREVPVANLFVPPGDDLQGNM
jgi:hypothetical protein